MRRSILPLFSKSRSSAKKHDGDANARPTRGRSSLLLVGAALTLLLLVVILSVRSYLRERGPVYESIQCIFKKVGSLDSFVRSEGAAPRTIEEILDSEPRRGFFSGRFPTDKDQTHNYTLTYDVLFKPYRRTARNVLEVGVKKGGSLVLWREYFGPATMIYGVDVDPGVPQFTRDAHFKVIVGSSADRRIMADAFRGLEEAFDVILDDGRHTPGAIRETWAGLRPFLSKTGVYVVEDWDVRWPLAPVHEFFTGLQTGDRVIKLPDASGYECLLVIVPVGSLASEWADAQRASDVEAVM